MSNIIMVKYEDKIKINRCIIKNDTHTFINIINKINYKWFGYELIKAVESGSIDIVAYLLANGFNPNSYISDNVLDIAIINHDINIVYLLLRNNYIPSLNCFTILIRNQQLDIIKIIAPYIKYKHQDFINIANRHANINNNFEIYNYLTSLWSKEKNIKSHSPTKEKTVKTNSHTETINPPSPITIKPPSPTNEKTVKPIHIEKEENSITDNIKSPILHTFKRSYPNRDINIYFIGRNGILSKSDLIIETNVPLDWIPIKNHFGLYWYKLKDHIYRELNYEPKLLKDYNQVDQNNPYGYEIILNKYFFGIEQDIPNIYLPIEGPDLSQFIINSEILNNLDWYVFSTALKRNLQKLVIGGYGKHINVNSPTLQNDIIIILSLCFEVKEREEQLLEEQYLELNQNQNIKTLVNDILS